MNLYIFTVIIMSCTTERILIGTCAWKVIIIETNVAQTYPQIEHDTLPHALQKHLLIQEL